MTGGALSEGLGQRETDWARPDESGAVSADSALPGLPSGPAQGVRLPGDVVANRYSLRHPIASGGMGQIWEAYDLRLEVVIALKLVRDEGRGSTLDERLLEEARAAAAAAGDHVVQVLDIGVDGDARYLAMEMVPGEPLAAKISESVPLEPTEAVLIALSILRGLAAVHRSGVVHRDIKPENVMVIPTDGGGTRTKILDFGVARRLSHDVRLTREGYALGTPLYMAPEQAAALDDIDARADVWAVSVVLYEMLAACTPFAAADFRGVICNIHRGEYASLSS
ncbi:MAG: serine/threonine-protein kinase, partial [Myxococcota bacterium]